MPTVDELLKQLQDYNPKAQVAVVRRAYDFASEVHAGQKRVVYQDDVFAHAICVAQQVLRLKLDSITVAAALLHNVLEYTKIKPEKMGAIFGRDILNIVEAQTKFKHIRFETSEEEKAEQLRKVLLASVKDVRIILLKLADVLENVKCLAKVPEQIKKERAQEALDIYAPIAHKLGIYKLKNEMEDFALSHTEPQQYEFIVKKVAETREERERQVARFIEELKDKINAVGIKCIVYGRAKSYYSIYKKLHEKYSFFDDIHDLLAVRVIVSDTDACYKVLGIIHGAWRYVPNLFGDYIANPKPNGYQSIHTKVLYNEKIIEVQIRSMEMHREAEEGIAAHWAYKGTGRDKKFDRKIAWLKQILEWQAESANARDFLETLKIDLFKGEIIVFSPKGEPITLPERSTPLDFAYEVHTALGNHCTRAKINGVLVPLDTMLHSGDIVEIVAAKNAVPSRHWLNFVTTPHARNKIRQALHIKGDDHKKQPGPGGKFLSAILVDDQIDAIVKFSKCCAPKVGDPITGFRMRDGKISVHLGDCSNLVSMKAFQNVSVRWKNITAVQKKINITVSDHVGLIAGILNVFSRKNIALSSINTKHRKDRIVISLGVLIDDDARLEQVLKSIRQIPNVKDLGIVR